MDYTGGDAIRAALVRKPTVCMYEMVCMVVYVCVSQAYSGIAHRHTGGSVHDL